MAFGSEQLRIVLCRNAYDLAAEESVGGTWAFLCLSDQLKDSQQDQKQAGQQISVMVGKF